MEMTKKRKNIMKRMIDRNIFFVALSSEWENDEKELFKENYGGTFEEAEQAHLALIEWLNK